MPPGLLEEAVNRAQSKTAALADVLCGEERIGGTRDGLRGRAGSGIRDRDHDVTACLHFRIGRGVSTTD